MLSASRQSGYYAALKLSTAQQHIFKRYRIFFILLHFYHPDSFSRIKTFFHPLFQMEETIVACTIEQCQTCVGALLLLKQFAPLYFVFLLFIFIFFFLSYFILFYFWLLVAPCKLYSDRCSLFLIVEPNPLITRKGLPGCLRFVSLSLEVYFILLYFFVYQLRGLVFTLFWCNR